MAPLKDAIDALVKGLPIVIPTDTVYGLAALPDVPGAVDAIFRIKDRPPDKALPILAATLDDLRAVATFDARAAMLAEAFWPGPLTLVLPRASSFTYGLGGRDDETVAVRIPDCRPALELMQRAGPLAVTSANRSGRAPATSVAESQEALGEAVSIFVEGGVCNGTPSTVLSLVGEARVLRSGALEADVLLQKVMS